MEAAKDLRLACKIDFDDQADEWLKDVTPNVSYAFIHPSFATNSTSFLSRQKVTISLLGGSGLFLVILGGRIRGGHSVLAPFVSSHKFRQLIRNGQV